MRARPACSKQGAQHQICELLQRVPGQAVLQVVAGGQVQIPVAGGHGCGLRTCRTSEASAPLSFSIGRRRLLTSPCGALTSLTLGLPGDSLGVTPEVMGLQQGSDDPWGRAPGVEAGSKG